jgi:integrase/recombinase XerD
VRTRAGAERLAFEEALKLYLDHLERHPSSLRLAAYALPRLLEHLGSLGLDDLRAVGEAHLVAYAHRLQTHPGRRGTPMTPAARRSFLSCIRGFFAFLEARRLILMNPARDLPLPKVDKLPGAVPSEAQVNRLIDAAAERTSLGARDSAIVEVLYGTGLRLSECCRLDLSDVDFSDSVVLVRDGKGKKDRIVPLPGRAAAALSAYLREVHPWLAKDPKETALFLSLRQGRRLGIYGIEAILVRCRRLSKIPVRVSPHILRHACATHLIKHGADVRHVQALLGHKRLDTTALYTRVAIKDLHDVIARAHPRERMEERQAKKRVK